MPYNPCIEIAVLNKALQFAARDTLSERLSRPTTEDDIKQEVAGWIKEARQFYTARARQKLVGEAARKANRGQGRKTGSKKYIGSSAQANGLGGTDER